MRERLLQGKLADGTLMPQYAISTLKRKKRQGTLKGNGVYWSLYDTGGFHKSIKNVGKGDNLKVKATFKKGLRILLASKGISTKQVLGF